MAVTVGINGFPLAVNGNNSVSIKVHLSALVKNWMTMADVPLVERVLPLLIRYPN